MNKVFKNHPEINAEWLYQKHHGEKLSTREIGVLCGVDHKTIIYRMKIFGINRIERTSMSAIKSLSGEASPRWGKRGEKCPYFGRKHTAEEKAKMMGRTKEKNYKWRGGISHHMSGYILIKVDNHPFASKIGSYVLEHRLVMEAKIGRYLTSEEVVHHINGIKNDNRPENLALFSSKGEHVKNGHKRINGRFAS